MFHVEPFPISRHMNLNPYADKIEKAALGVRVTVPLFPAPTDVPSDQTIAEGKTITGDLGGKASTKQYTDAIVQKLAKA